MDQINSDMKLAEQALRSMDLLCGIFPKFWKKSGGFKEDDAVWGDQKVSRRYTIYSPQWSVGVRSVPIQLLQLKVAFTLGQITLRKMVVCLPKKTFFYFSYGRVYLVLCRVIRSV